jgi:hypothetical protein
VRRLLAAALALLALLVSASGVAADEGVTVRASEAQVNFPRGVTFRLEAESAVQISDVQLQLNTPGQRYGNAVRNVRPTFTPGDHISATWSWQRFGSVLPPGAEISYRWRITDAEGRVTETPLSSLRVQDDRHTWRELSDGNVTVRWYRGDDAFGRDLLASARESVDRIQAQQGVDLHYPVTVHVYGSQQELFEAIPGVPGWIGGISIPEFDTVVVGFGPQDLSWGRRALTHELTHQMVFQMTAHPTLGSRVPVWLNEGLAVVSEGEIEPAAQKLLDDAVRGDMLPTLRNLAGSFTIRDGHLAGVAYAAAESAVRYLLQTYGADRMRAMLLALGEAATPDEAARRAYGRNLYQIEDGWRTSLGLKPFDRGDASDAATVPTAVPLSLPAATLASGSSSDLALWLGGGIGLLAVVFLAGGTLLIARKSRRTA